MYKKSRLEPKILQSPSKVHVGFLRQQKKKFVFNTMYFVQFGLLSIIAIVVKAAPQAKQYPPYGTPVPYQQPAGNNQYPSSYDTIEPTPYPYPDPYNPSADFYNVTRPSIASGIGFFLILNSGSGHYDDEPNGIDNNHKDLNVIVGFFNGVEETARDGLELLVRKIQSILEPNQNFHDGRLETLLRDLGLIEIKSLAEFKNFLLPNKNEEVEQTTIIPC